MYKGTSFKLIDIDVYAIIAFGKNRTRAAIERFGQYREKGRDYSRSAARTFDTWPINKFLSCDVYNGAGFYRPFLVHLRNGRSPMDKETCILCYF
jgi:hypothetical protein